MGTASYDARRGELTTYFDRTAVEAWSRLTSDAPVSRVRATVRAGRDAMRANLLSWLPADMKGLRLLDAGCGTGALGVEAARRGAEVIAVDVSPTLIGLAKERLPAILGPGGIDFRVGDMLDPGLGRFDHVVAMDSLIHYRPADIARALARLAARTDGSILFTMAPRTALLTLMHAAGKLFPRGDRSPAIVPVTEGGLRRRIGREPGLEAFTWAQSRRIDRGFYLSNAIALARALPPPSAGEGTPRSGGGEGQRDDAGVGSRRGLSGSGAPLSRPLLTQGLPSPAEGGGEAAALRGGWR